MVGFIQETILESSPIVEQDFRHALCTGQTGCGKTTSFILPNIADRIQKGYGMLIVDVKGNLHSQVKVLADEHGRLEDVKEIGVVWGDSVNIFENVSRSLLLDILRDIDGKDKPDRFWINSALGIAGHLFDLFDVYKNVKSLCPINLDKTFPYEFCANSINKLLSSFDSLNDFIKACDRLVRRLSRMRVVDMRNDGLEENSAYLLYQFIQEFDSIATKLKNFHEEIDTESPSSGQGGVFMVLKNILQPFSQDGLNGEGQLKQLLEEGKIVVLHADTYDENLNMAIMNILYKQLLKRHTSKPITLFVDEFQRSVSSDNIPYIDMFREMNVELIAAMQNIEQLENKLGKSRCDEFFGNILHRYEYANHLHNTLKSFEYRHSNKISSAAPTFITDKQRQVTQIKWQNKTNRPLSEGWIYLRSDGYKRVVIFNVATQQQKYHYFLEEKDSSLAYEFSLLKNSNHALSA
jgi:TraM recognition site of TraD and TraG